RWGSSSAAASFCSTKAPRGATAIATPNGHSSPTEARILRANSERTRSCSRMSGNVALVEPGFARGRKGAAEEGARGLFLRNGRPSLALVVAVRRWMIVTGSTRLDGRARRRQQRVAHGEDLGDVGGGAGVVEQGLGAV